MASWTPCVCASDTSQPCCSIWLAALHQSGLVPCLVDGSLAVWESHSIVRYLAQMLGCIQGRGRFRPSGSAISAAMKWSHCQCQYDPDSLRFTVTHIQHSIFKYIQRIQHRFNVNIRFLSGNVLHEFCIVTYVTSIPSCVHSPGSMRQSCIWALRRAWHDVHLGWTGCCSPSFMSAPWIPWIPWIPWWSLVLRCQLDQENDHAMVFVKKIPTMNWEYRLLPLGGFSCAQEKIGRSPGTDGCKRDLGCPQKNQQTHIKS